MGASGILIPINLLCLFTLVNMDKAVTDDTLPVQTTPHGFNITIDQAPYVASLRHYQKEIKHFGDGIFCMATIIKNRVLITSAHCLKKKKMTDSVVVIGSAHLKIRTPATKMLSIAAWRKHGLYKFLSSEYDIALIFTYDDIEPVQGFVAYAPFNYMEVRKWVKCLEFGWYRNYKVRYYGNLQAIWVTSLSRKECYDKHLKKPGFMCTHSKSAMAAPSESGSALICNNKLAGIVTSTDYEYKSLKASPRKGQRAAKPLATSTSIPIRSTCVQWTVFRAICIYVAYILAPIFYFYCNF